MNVPGLPTSPAGSIARYSIMWRPVPGLPWVRLSITVAVTECVPFLR